MRQLTVTTPAGKMPVDLFSAAGAEKAPLVILLMDAIGIRRELRDLADDISQQGYTVALPNLFYREGHFEDIDFSTPEGHETVMRLYGGLSHAMVKEDIGALLSQVEARPAGLLGFCMGGANALVLAGAYPDDIAAAAAIHPGGIATEAPDSPHRSVVGAHAKLYIAIADEDPYATPEQVDELESALTEASIAHTLEVYRGAHHGFSFESLPTFNAEARQRYWEATMRLFGETLKSA